MDKGWRELTLVVIVSGLLTVAMTYPLAFKLGTVGRVDNGDGLMAIWNVAWVARSLITDPLHVFDANIFYPHRLTLSYSESNLGAGVLAIPAYWLTRGNPYAAHNSVVLLSFVLSATGMYYLARYLTADRRAAVVSAICFAFSPYLFAHTAHIQLLMTAGLPFSMLAFHRLADRPSPARGAVLGTVMAAQAISCGYYGVFVLLMVGFAVIIVAAVRRRWKDARYWLAVGIAAGVAVALIMLPFLPYASLRDGGFRRSLAEARVYSANWSAYLASGSHAHRWMLHYLPKWNDVLFPGFVALVAGLAALVSTDIPFGEVKLLYGGLTALAFWASFGPDAGLYALLYRVLPMFGWLRAPARLGIIVALGLSVLAGAAVARVLQRSRSAAAAGAVIMVVAAAELVVPLHIPGATPVNPVYQVLAVLPRAPVIEMPFYYPEVGLYQHTKYMLASTAHWMPLANGYSDHIPLDFYEHVMTLATFPSEAGFKVLQPAGVRYAIFHMYGYNAQNRSEVLGRLKRFTEYLRPIYMTEDTRLYEIVGFPP
ncbi:MAG: hypothetical protein DMF98_15075 [Acidobacteria bacterium]|nr:MAG: hypothetical protein DMF98_15075 [Acidobacteriota bacterium]